MGVSGDPMATPIYLTTERTIELEVSLGGSCSKESSLSSGLLLIWKVPLLTYPLRCILS